MIRMLVLPKHNDEGAFWRHEGKVRMGHSVTLTTRHPNLVRLERDGSIELANGRYDHDKPVAATVAFGKCWKSQ